MLSLFKVFSPRASDNHHTRTPDDSVVCAFAVSYRLHSGVCGFEIVKDAAISDKNCLKDNRFTIASIE